MFLNITLVVSGMNMRRTNTEISYNIKCSPIYAKFAEIMQFFKYLRQSHDIKLFYEDLRYFQNITQLVSGMNNVHATHKHQNPHTSIITNVPLIMPNLKK